MPCLTSRRIGAWPRLARHLRAGRAVALTGAWLLLGALLSARAQNFSVRNWHLEEGLPDGEITALAQTPEGYLWVGTPKGLARFDGNRWRVYLPRNTPELPDPGIANLLTDQAGRLWIGTADGSMLRWRDGKFTRIPPAASPLPAADHGRLPTTGRQRRNWQLVEDADHRIWWLQRGILLTCFDSRETRSFQEITGLQVNQIEQMGRDAAGGVWLVAESRLRRFQPFHQAAEAEILPISWPSPDIVLQPSLTQGLLVAEPLRGSWQKFGGQIRRLQDGRWTGPFAPTPLVLDSPRSTVTALLEDRSGRMWIGTLSGGVYFSDPEGQWRRLRPGNFLTEGNVSCLLQDTQDNLWVGTLGDGLYRVTRQPVTVVSLPSPNPLPAPIQSTCAAHDGALWIGTEGDGLFRYQNGQATNVGRPLNSPDLWIYSVWEDRATNLWLGTRSGLLRLESGALSPVVGPAELSHPMAALYEDPAGRLWCGTSNEVIARIGGEFTVFPFPGDHSPADVRSFIAGPNQELWVGTLGRGLFALAAGPEGRLRPVPGFPARSARALAREADGSLWIGCWGEGLIRFRRGQFTPFTSQDGLPDDKILGLVFDRAGMLWISSDNAIFGLRREALDAYVRGASPPLLPRRLSLSEGVANRACSGWGQPVGTRTPDGRIWFPNLDQLAGLQPELAISRRAVPPVILESLRADGVEITAPPDGQYRVASSIRRFEFSFASPDLSDSREVHFRHQLVGMDERWREASGERIAYYSQLPPAHYRFRVTVGGSDGLWHESAQAINFEVVPRFWEIRWLQVLGGALFLSAVVVVGALQQRRQYRRRLGRMELLQSLEQERRRIARDLHDELGARLTSIALQGELAMRGTVLPTAAKTEIGAWVGRVRQLISATDEVIWTTDPGNDHLPNVAEYLCDYVERFLTPAGIAYRLDMPPELPPVVLSSQARHNFLLAVKETLNNAVRHSRASLLTVRLSVTHETIELLLNDNGTGFDVTQTRTGSNGLANIRKRLALLGGQAEIRSAPGQGTTTRLTIPLAGMLRAEPAD